MKGDIPNAALRVMAACRTTIHERFGADASRADILSIVKRAPDKRLRPNGKRPVQVGGRKYASITQAKCGEHVSPATLYLWLDTGKARYI